jgi:hypothetical protein
MKRTDIVRVIIAVLTVVASLFLVCGAMATTENECISGGGTISAGSGCKFCVGGKYDLSEIKDTGKDDTSRSGSEQKTGGASGQAATGASTKASNNNRM